MPSTKAANVSPATSAATNHHETSASSAASRKRVFTFQKRWLHSLPIVERALFESELTGRVPKALHTPADASSTAAVKDESIATAQNVIVCMLCDDPASKREPTKIWNRLNCRRGRIENHLMSKHPEFMRLLKYKREAEGDVAVQLFLQSLREGRCNLRTEIDTGLYSQLAINASSPLPSGTETSALFKRSYSEYMNVLELHTEGSHRKRFKSSTSSLVSEHATTPTTPLITSVGGTLMPLHQAITEDNSVLYQEALPLSQWQTVFANKLVVVTGGDNNVIAFVATQLWLLGANVLLTFTTMSAVDEFNTKHIGRFPDPSESDKSPRGVMLPMLSSFQSVKTIHEWCTSIASKYQRVDYLINYAESDVVEAFATAEESTRSVSTYVSWLLLSFVDNLIDKRCIDERFLEILCEAMASTCFPDRVPDDESWSLASNGTIVNIASLSEETLLEPLVKRMATKLQSRHVQLNCILLPMQSIAERELVHSEGIATLSHTILFLLSPLSRFVSGSVLRVGG
ncbi:hypothetical protein CCR75_001295 [Bremia lactucae]|uniref:Uncharacterized protein n=1 Tax=Bremia lactucae TaxID=4779 RepID=A0A976FN80_BRELC|nr:hypothetical protein CCR75_001295 [Bremia lactucae]